MTWTERDKALHRDIKTPDFMTSFNVVSAVVPPAEAMNHHPDIEFGWGYARIKLTTHDAGGVTEKDRKLAELIDEALKPLGL
ncbi:MAG: 4a-hydroxytetrahydrobiopterin dehydratase [Holophagaceae bacterium]|nr:4a-hydroxytetrahydrobiopterin dehydratase [Holophagaceae bacterium]